MCDVRFGVPGMCDRGGSQNGSKIELHALWTALMAVWSNWLCVRLLTE